MSVFTDLLEASAPLLISTAKSIADGFVDGATLNKDQKQAMFTAYVVINVWGDDLVESTENEYDDVFLTELSDFIKDQLGEAGITVPVIPDELLEAAPPEPAPDAN